jgi:hypothetical protein
MSETRRIVIFRLLLLVILSGIGSAIWFTDIWNHYIDLIVYGVLVPLGIKQLPIMLSLSLTFIVVYFPVVLLGYLIRKFFRPYISPSKKIEHELSIKKLGEIKKLSGELYSYIQSLQKGADSLHKTYTTLSDDIKLLEALKADNLKELKSKFVVFRERGIFEKIILAIVGFIGGLLANVFSNYISEILR